ncbi:DUF4276 family protein [Stenotrophomonas sp.]|uniref:DUF4276 family protein n=1 Tax=Stenotrophomonas sp. TaxID=69392 RepID=UPI0028A913C4|nr:DUF4276 family protein [Stenotrophomonas sp.]
MTTLVFCLEEESAKFLLEGILPRIIGPDIDVRFLVFEGKQDLQSQLGRRLRGWLAPDTHFVVLHDQDSGDCVALKSRLREICNEAGKPNALIRIACHELETFYLGDLGAVERALHISGLARQQISRKFRDPDALNNAAQELKKISDKKYQKLNGSRLISPEMTLDGTNRSKSFNQLCTGIRRLIAA